MALIGLGSRLQIELASLLFDQAGRRTPCATAMCLGQHFMCDVASKQDYQRTLARDFGACWS
jgi:hypothetical protein